MEPENLVLNLGSHAAAALTVLTMTRHALPAPDDLPATARAGATQSTSGQLWSDMKERWLPTAASTSAT